MLTCIITIHKQSETIQNTCTHVNIIRIERYQLEGVYTYMYHYVSTIGVHEDTIIPFERVTEMNITHSVVYKTYIIH